MEKGFEHKKDSVGDEWHAHYRIRERGAKATFRTLRETVGLSQSEVAEMIGENAGAIGRWEDPKCPEMLPLESCVAFVRAIDSQMASAAYDAAPFCEYYVSPATGTRPHADIVYYYDHVDPDITGGSRISAGIINTTIREAAAILADAGYDVTYIYPHERPVGRRPRYL